MKSSLSCRIKDELYRNGILYIMAIPVILYFILFMYLPMFGLVIAFKKYDIAKGIFGSQWVGFRYFKEFFTGLYFKRTLKNTLILSGGNILFGFPAPIIFALLLNELCNKHFKKAVQTITYLPHFISLVVVCGMLTNFFSSDGVATQIIMKFGGEKMNYLASTKYFRTIYIASEIWQSIGWNSIIYLAALTGIDMQLYEAAVIDGAGKWKQMLHVTLPGILPTISVMLILEIGKMLSLGYEKVILLYSPNTYEVADIISSFVYRKGLNNFMYSYASAVGLFQSVVNIILLIASNKLSKRISGSALF